MTRAASKQSPKTAQIAAWIRRALAADPPRAKSLVVTIFGDSIAPHAEFIWLQSLIDLLAPFGVNERLVRSSVFRLIKEGWLTAERHGRQSRYAFTVTGRKRFEHAHDKIYFPADRRWNCEWTLVITPSAQIPAPRRALLREELEWEGFRMISSGTFAHPAADRSTVADILERLRFPQVIVCSAKDIARDSGTLQAQIARHWDLKTVQGSYRKFISALRPMMEILENRALVDQEQAFVMRTLLIHAFRRILLQDPLLPPELLPEAWPGPTAYDLCRSVYRCTYSDAEKYILHILGEEAISQPSRYFANRFGGVVI